MKCCRNRVNPVFAAGWVLLEAVIKHQQMSNCVSPLRHCEKMDRKREDCELLCVRF